MNTVNSMKWSIYNFNKELDLWLSSNLAIRPDVVLTPTTSKS